MKKMLLTAAMVSVALTSCVTDESFVDVAKKDGEIKFVAANYAAQSRGGHGEIDLANTGFTVYAWEDNQNYALMNGVQMAYTNNAWTPTDGKKYYWPNQVALDFTAVAPATNNFSTVTRSDAGVTTIKFDFSSTANPTNVNLMYADYVNQSYDYDAASPNANVALLFRHVLAKLKVVLTQKDPAQNEDGVLSYEVKVKSLKISGIANKGSLTVDDAYVTDAKGDNANEVWSDASGSAEWSIYTGEYSLQTNTVSAGVLSKTATNLVSTDLTGHENYYVMPQTVSGQTLTVEYDVVTTFTSGSVATRPYEKTINLSAISAVTNWYTNKYITYTINISPADLMPITFSAKEENWCEDVNGSQDVK